MSGNGRVVDASEIGGETGVSGSDIERQIEQRRTIVGLEDNLAASAQLEGQADVTDPRRLDPGSGETVAFVPGQGVQVVDEGAAPTADAPTEPTQSQSDPASAISASQIGGESGVSGSDIERALDRGQRITGLEEAPAVAAQLEGQADVTDPRRLDPGSGETVAFVPGEGVRVVGGGSSSGGSSAGQPSQQQPPQQPSSEPAPDNTPEPTQEQDQLLDGSAGGSSGGGSDGGGPFGGDSPPSTPDAPDTDTDNPFGDSGGSGNSGSDDSDNGDSPPVGNTPGTGNLPGGQPDEDTGRDPETIDDGPASQDQTPEQGIEEDGSPAEQQTAQQVEEQFLGQLEEETGRDFDAEDVRIETEQQGGQTVAVPELTETGEEQIQFEQNQRELDATRDAISQIDQQTEADLTAGDDITVQDGQVTLTDQGRLEEAAAQLDDADVDDLDIVGGQVVRDTGDTDVSPGTPGTGQDTARSQVVEQLEEETGTDLSREDVTFSETDDGAVQGQLSDQGEKTVAAANAPFADVPGVGDVTQAGAVADEQIEDATDPAAEGFDDVTPDQQDAIDVVESAVETGASTDVPFTDTDFGDVNELVPEDDSPQGANRVAFEASVAAEQALSGVSEEQARQNVAEDVEAADETTVDAFSPAVGRSPAGAVNAARGAAGIAGIAGGAVAVNELDVGESTQDQSELTVGETASQSELQVSEQTTSELSVSESVTSSELEVQVDQQQPVDQAQLSQQLLIGEETTQDPEITEEDISDPFAEPDQAPPSTRERQRREDLDPFERTFPTGGSAVVGESTSDPVEELEEQVDQSQRSEIEQGTDAGVGSGQVQGPIVGRQPDQTVDEQLDQIQDGIQGQVPDQTQDSIQDQTQFEEPTDTVFETSGGTGFGTPAQTVPVEEQLQVQEPVQSNPRSSPVGRRLPRFNLDSDEDEVEDIQEQIESGTFGTGFEDAEDILGR